MYWQRWTSFGGSAEQKRGRTRGSAESSKPNIVAIRTRTIVVRVNAAPVAACIHLPTIPTDPTEGFIQQMGPVEPASLTAAIDEDRRQS